MVKYRKIMMVLVKLVSNCNTQFNCDYVVLIKLFNFKVVLCQP